MPSKDHELFVLITNLHGTDRISGEMFERLKLFLINPLYRPEKDDANHWVTIGNTMVHEGEFSLALKCYANAIEINPNNLDAWNNIAITFESIGCTDEAMRCRQKIVEISMPQPQKTKKAIPFL